MQSPNSIGFFQGAERKSIYEQAVSECEKAGFSVNGSPTQDRVEPQTSLTKTGGLPIILVPIALLVVGRLLVRKSTAL